MCSFSPSMEVSIRHKSGSWNWQTVNVKTQVTTVSNNIHCSYFYTLQYLCCDIYLHVSTEHKPNPFISLIQKELWFNLPWNYLHCNILRFNYVICHKEFRHTAPLSFSDFQVDSCFESNVIILWFISDRVVLGQGQIKFLENACWRKEMGIKLKLRKELESNAYRN